MQHASQVEEFDGETDSKAFFEFMGNAYMTYMAGDDERYNAFEAELEAKIGASTHLAGQIFWRGGLIAISLTVCSLTGGKYRALQEEVDEVAQANEELKRRIEQAKNAKVSAPERERNNVYFTVLGLLPFLVRGG